MRCILLLRNIVKPHLSWLKDEVENCKPIESSMFHTVFVFSSIMSKYPKPSRMSASLASESPSFFQQRGSISSTTTTLQFSHCNHSLSTEGDSMRLLSVLAVPSFRSCSSNNNTYKGTQCDRMAAKSGLALIFQSLSFCLQPDCHSGMLCHHPKVIIQRSHQHEVPRALPLLSVPIWWLVMLL